MDYVSISKSIYHISLKLQICERLFMPVFPLFPELGLPFRWQILKPNVYYLRLISDHTNRKKGFSI